MTARQTKWSILQDRLVAATAAYNRARAEIESLEETPFTMAWDRTQIGACSTCHTPLPTEEAFARHYTVPDRRYPNLGYCPTKDEIK